MRAATYDRYGAADVLRLSDVPQPSLRPGEVLVRVKRAALNPKDALFRRGKFRLVSGRRFPKRTGLDLAGEVEATRSPRWSVGQRVFGFLDEWTFHRGTLAEMCVCRDTELAHLPGEVTEDAGAAVALAGLTALQALRDVARVRPADRVLIHGASGGVGTLAIQIARRLGAEPHAVSSAANQALCSSLGAQRTWTYPEHAWKREAPFDVVFDVFGNLRFAAVRAHLTPRACFVSTVPSARRLLRDRTSRWSKHQERVVIVRPRTIDLALLGGWLAQGLLRPVIDSRYPLERAREAFARLESKHARGKILLEVA
jgi:NADPH:quinone reductase-like Zn-dependent oxidoreductase